MKTRLGWTLHRPIPDGSRNDKNHHTFLINAEEDKAVHELVQWSSNFFARGTLKSPKNFWRHTQICQNGKIDTETL
jgi:hypothetical protein